MDTSNLASRWFGAFTFTRVIQLACGIIIKPIFLHFPKNCIIVQSLPKYPREKNMVFFVLICLHDGPLMKEI